MNIQPVIASKPNRVLFFFWDWRAALLMVICLELFYGNLNAPCYDKQEAREALVVWEINHSGNWILPLRNGKEIPSKPPLYHWLAAITSKAADRLNEITLQRMAVVRRDSRSSPSTHPD